ncbi:MAG: GatB/YqeY domain-containing protein [Anaerolineae bacterium]|nr:GatB/YqeY domain-containing protein [Anaerolineae bacterium]
MAEYSDKLMTALKEAMKSKDKQRRDTIRLLQAAFKQVVIDTRKELSTEQELELLQKEAKKRKESIKELENAGRAEQAADEQYELELIASFLPEMMSREEIEVLAKQAIADTGAESQRDMGKVMGKMMPHTKGKADGSLVSQVVRELLNS